MEYLFNSVVLGNSCLVLENSCLVLENSCVVLEKTLNDIRDVGEVEGLNVNPKTKQLLVHANRGKQIVLGMPKGFYPGYDREISEIYFYDMKPRCNK